MEKPEERDNRNAAPLISVIVPIYNVEKYIRKCLDSLKGQTLREIEIICIDDGSTDGSGRIADEYVSQEWPRFRVFHTENRGLSAARNRGIDEAETDWIMFVDSDDWVSEDFCRLPYEAACKYEADLVIFRSCNVNRGKANIPQKSDISSELIDEYTAHKQESVVAWNKLYKAFLFANIRYPEGHVDEDLAITHRLVHEARKILKIHTILYYKNNRRNSISHLHTGRQKEDNFIFCLERQNELQKWGFPIETINPRLCSAALGFLAYTPYSEDQLHMKAEEIINSVDRFPNTYPVLKRVALTVWKIDKKMFFFCSRLAVVLRR